MDRRNGLRHHANRRRHALLHPLLHGMLHQSTHRCFWAGWERQDGLVNNNGGNGYVSGDLLVVFLNQAIVAACDEGNSPRYAADGNFFYQFGEPELRIFPW